MKLDRFSYTSFSNLELIEKLYIEWQSDPMQVDSSWRGFFEGLELGQAFPVKGKFESPELRIYALISAYRSYGHLFAKFNPLAVSELPFPKELELANFGLKEKDLTQSFPTCSLLKKKEAPLQEIIEVLRQIYCSAIGYEFMGLGFPEMEKWIQEQIEPELKFQLGSEEKIEVLKELNRAEVFETFIHTKYVGQKRFSLEGGETLIPMLTGILAGAADQSVTDIVIGMAHRGRLNVLANILGKSYSYIFHEFEDHYTPDLSESTGDVKYHKGFSGKYLAKNGREIEVFLSANASHLESVDPIVEGITRAMQELKKSKERRNEIMPILIHGDASLAGQGVVYETMQMERLNGYGTCGTLHIVINNQIGFTTLPKDGRSTRYCTDIAKTFGSPVFHVNAEDPEGCKAIAKLAFLLRQQFGCDVFIDLNGYRKYGHNESDEPTFTQPVEYELIKSKKTIRQIYRDRLIQENILDEKSVEEFEEQFKTSLNEAKEKGKTLQGEKKEINQPKKDLSPFFSPLNTQVRIELLRELGIKFSTVPERLKISPKILHMLDERKKILEGDSSRVVIDWATGELLAYATLVNEGIHIRLSGQDSRRGTFSHRHAIWVDQVSSERYFPLSHLREGQALCDIFNSHLSELGVLGFEFGYSLIYQKSVVLWEAQFGDFANGAQVVIDQYISTSEQKWNHPTNITLLLPHGYEGQGPEHSSARIERFLQLCGEGNMIIANCTTPAQLFHLIRRQGLREKMRKPLVIFTPKVLLRHPRCLSSLNDFSTKGFEEILDDPSPPSNRTKLVLCSGKIFYELLEQREKRKTSNMVILRIEQLYPFHETMFLEYVKKYSSCKQCIWLQEEHSNMGAWEYIRPILQNLLKEIPLVYIGRGRSAATAAGSFALHKRQQDEFIEALFQERG
ncbi:MAG: 2-oxoglutarate dehydrogenase E1 component [Chlamydiae bacterium]|nr:2-oxoglutarate dehydrogenase E1 component [Chlamydiota bacterium]